VDPATYKRGNQLYRRKLRATAVPGAAFHIEVSRAATNPPVQEASLAAAP
jgi:hypothetical protein